MITVKQYIVQQQDAAWNLDNPHLLNLQDNEIVLIDDIPYIKTKVIFAGSENPKEAKKVSNLEMENMRLQLEVEHLLLEYESVLVRNESLQHYVYNLQQDVEREMAKRKKIQQEKEILQEEVKKMTAQIKVLKKEKEEILLEKKVEKAIFLMEETSASEDLEMEQTPYTPTQKIEKLTLHIQSLKEQNENLLKKNNKLRHAAQFFGEVSNTVNKLNSQIQKAKSSFEKTGIDIEKMED